MVANIVSAVKRSETVNSQQQKQPPHHNNQGTDPEAMEGGEEGRSDVNGLAPVTGATNRNHMLEVPRTTDFAYKRKSNELPDSNPSNNNKHNPQNISGGVSTGGNGRFSMNGTTTAAGFNDGEEEDLSSEGSFLQVVKVMHCVPNHR